MRDVMQVYPNRKYGKIEVRRHNRCWHKIDVFFYDSQGRMEKVDLPPGIEYCEIDWSLRLLQFYDTAGSSGAGFSQGEVIYSVPLENIEELLL